MSDLVHELRGLAIGMASPSLARDTVSRAADEIERLRSALLEIKAGEEMTGADAMVIATRALQ